MFIFISQIQNDLSNADTSYGLLSRIVGVESAITLVQQFAQIRDYLKHLLLPNDHQFLDKFLTDTMTDLQDLRKPIYMCVAARVNDLDGILSSMAKVKWDINHINVEHSTYINNINRVSANIYGYFQACFKIEKKTNFFRVFKYSSCDWRKLKRRCPFQKNQSGIVLLMSCRTH